MAVGVRNQPVQIAARARARLQPRGLLIRGRRERGARDGGELRLAVPRRQNLATLA